MLLQQPVNKNSSFGGVSNADDCMANLRTADFFTGNPSYTGSSSYAELSVLKSYLAGNSSDGEASVSEAEFVCDAVELMTTLRRDAERRYKEKETQANNKRGELCLSIDAITDILTAKNDGKEAPEQLVSIIAKEHVRLIESLLSSMRKTLRRKRDYVPVSEVQQVDAHCLRWLARQPGQRAYEKAGMRQKLMAVVREETKNTLENRVLKDFLCRVAVLARRYVRNYEKGYPSSERLKSVRHLHSVLANALKLPEIQTLPQIVTAVQPNYVLLHDSLYGKLWELYRLVLEQTRISEVVWAERHRLFAEYFCMLFFASLNVEYKSFFDLSYWIQAMPSRGCFLVNPLFSSAFEDGNGDVLSCVVSSPGKIVLKSSTLEKNVQLLYIPEDATGSLLFPNDGVIYVVCCFSKSCREQAQCEENVFWIDALEQTWNAISQILKPNGK